VKTTHQWSLYVIQDGYTWEKPLRFCSLNVFTSLAPYPGALQCLKNWGGKNPKKTRFLMVWSQFLKKIGKILEKVRGQLPSCPPFSTALVSTNPWPLLGAKVKQKEQFFKKFWLFIIRLSKSICLSKYHSVRLFFWKILEDLILEGQRYLHTY